MKRNSIILTLLLGVNFVYAQEEQSEILDEMLIQSNRLQIPVNQNNRNITVLSSEQISKMPARTLNEVLSYVSGVDMRQRGAFGSQTDISLDGGNFEQTVILINGIKITDPQSGHNTMNIPIPVEFIDRVEILRGPAARAYGINSLTGAINIVTKTPSESRAFVQLFLGSNFKTDEENKYATYISRASQLGLTVAGEHHSQSIFASHESGNGYRYNTASDNNRLFYQGNFKLNSNHKVNAMLGYVSSDFGANGFYAAPKDKESHEIVRTTFAAIRSRHQLSSNFVISPTIGYRYGHDDYRFIRQNLNKYRSQHYTNTLTADLSANYQTNIGTFGMGAEYRTEDINSNNIGKHKRNNVGVYTEYRNNQLEKWDISLGTYINYNSFYGWQVFPAADVSYSANDYLKIILNSGTSQRIPSYTDLYLNQSVNKGNPNLKDEQGFQTEIGVKYHKNNLKAKAFAFYRNIDNYIDWTRNSVNEPWVANSSGALQTLGLNLGADYAINHLRIGLHYTYLEPKMESNGNFFSKYKIQSLKHHLVNTIGVEYDAFNLTVANRYCDRISKTNYYLMDIRLNYNQSSPYVFYIDVQNVFNKTYTEEADAPMPGRWFTIGMKYSL